MCKNYLSIPKHVLILVEILKMSIMLVIDIFYVQICNSSTYEKCLTIFLKSVSIVFERNIFFSIYYNNNKRALNLKLIIFVMDND